MADVALAVKTISKSVGSALRKRSALSRTDSIHLLVCIEGVESECGFP